MAGYVDPIDSPMTVIVHRRLPSGESLLIDVDLIKARYDASESILVQAGDVIYLKPDMQWWLRRQWDRVVPAVFTIPYNFTMTRLFFGS
jgi:hypothetical protein